MDFGVIWEGYQSKLLMSYYNGEPSYLWFVFMLNLRIQVLNLLKKHEIDIYWGMMELIERRTRNVIHLVMRRISHW